MTTAYTLTPEEAIVGRPGWRKPSPRPDVDILSRAVEKVGAVGIGGVLRELGVSAA